MTPCPALAPCACALQLCCLCVCVCVCVCFFFFFFSPALSICCLVSDPHFLGGGCAGRAGARGELQGPRPRRPLSRAEARARP